LPTAPYNLAQPTSKPMFSGEVNVIVVGQLVRDPGPDACVENEPFILPIEQVDGARLDMEPSWLPEGVTFVRGLGITCGDTLTYVEREYVVATNAETRRAGGSFAIRRSLRDPASGIDLVGPRDRLYSMVVGGRPAVGLRPLMPGGKDTGQMSAAIAIQEVDGFTVIQGTGLLWAELPAIASSLYADR
jgi:hypothetical protein